MINDRVKIKFDTGLVVMRAHVFHNEHYRLVKRALSMCERVVLLVGSADKANTERNPLPIKLRMEVIRKIFSIEIITGQLIVKQMDDMSDESDVPENGKWGRYVFKNFKLACGEDYPDLMVFGKHEESNDIKGWFLPSDSANTSELVLSRTQNPLSATKVRQFIIDDNYDEFTKNTPIKSHEYYNIYRDYLLSASKVGDSLKMENLFDSDYYGEFISALEGVIGKEAVNDIKRKVAEKI